MGTRIVPAQHAPTPSYGYRWRMKTASRATVTVLTTVHDFVAKSLQLIDMQCRVE